MNLKERTSAATQRYVEDYFALPGVVRMAADVAHAAHRHQRDKAGNYYIHHPRRVALAVVDYGRYAEAAALLHDVLEDTPITERYLRMLDFPAPVVEAVVALTRKPGEPVESYYERVRANLLAHVVKKADVADNADEERLALLTDDEVIVERLRAKYAHAMEVLR